MLRVLAVPLVGHNDGILRGFFQSSPPSEYKGTQWFQVEGWEIYNSHVYPNMWIQNLIQGHRKSCNLKKLHLSNTKFKKSESLFTIIILYFLPL